MDASIQQAPPDSSGATPKRRLGKYELIARIGEGGMAEVHLARMRGPMKFRKIVVVKTIHPDLASQDEFLKMLLDEARLSALIKHPRVVDIYDLGYVDGTYFIAMEYLDGQPLSMILTMGAKGDPLDVFSTARLVADAAEGLHAAHELRSMSGRPLELVHRDVSPGNVVVLFDGNVKLVDFGIAKARGRITTSGVRQLKGKMGYMAPEQLAGKPVDRRSDVFSLGVVLWEALSLQRLFPGGGEDTRDWRLLGDIPPPSTHRVHVPPALDAVTLRALAADPAERFQTAGEMQAAIEAVLRSAAYYRETGAIAAYMTRVFARRRAERARLLQRGEATSELPAISGGGEVDLTDPAIVASAPPFSDATGTDGALDLPPLVTTPTRSAAGALQPARVPTSPDALAKGTGSDPKSVTGAVAEREARRRLPLVAIVGLLAVGAAGLVLAGPLRGLVGGSPGRSAGSPAPTGAAASPAPVGAAVGDAAAGAGAGAPGVGSSPAAAPDAAALAGAGDGATPDAAGPRPLGPEVARPQGPVGPRPPRKSAAVLYEEGTALFVQGKAAQARDRFRQAIEADPRYAPAHRGLGLVLQAQGSRDKAVAAFERYLRLNPGAADGASIRRRIEQLQR